MEPKAQRWRNEPEQNAMSRNKRDESAAARLEPCRNMSQTCEARLLALSSECAKRRAYMSPLTLSWVVRRVFAWPTYGLHMNRTQPLTRSDLNVARRARGQRKGTKLKPKKLAGARAPAHRAGRARRVTISRAWELAKNATRDDSRLPQRVRVCEHQRTHISFQCVSEANYHCIVVCRSAGVSVLLLIRIETAVLFWRPDDLVIILTT